MAVKDKVIRDIAKRFLSIEGLSNSTDTKEITLWDLKTALEEAFDAGWVAAASQIFDNQ